MKKSTTLSVRAGRRHQGLRRQSDTHWVGLLAFHETAPYTLKTFPHAAYFVILNTEHFLNTLETVKSPFEMNSQQRLVLHPKVAYRSGCIFLLLTWWMLKKTASFSREFSRTHGTCTNTALLWQIWVHTHFGEPALNTAPVGFSIGLGKLRRVLEKCGTLGAASWNLLCSLVFSRFFWKFHVTDGHLLNFWVPKGRTVIWQLPPFRPTVTFQPRLRELIQALDGASLWNTVRASKGLQGWWRISVTARTGETAPEELFFFFFFFNWINAFKNHSPKDFIT